MAEKTKRTMFRHWSLQQDLHYYFFLIISYHESFTDKRSSRIFLKMSKFIKKSHQQCRTHHQKKLQQLKRLYGSGELQLRNLYKFYYENYKLRLLGQDHLRYELKSFLKETCKSFEQNLKKVFEQWLKKLDDNISTLQLQKFCLNYNKSSVETQTEKNEVSIYLSLDQDESQKKGKTSHLQQN